MQPDRLALICLVGAAALGCGSATLKTGPDGSAGHGGAGAGSAGHGGVAGNGAAGSAGHGGQAGSSTDAGASGGAGGLHDGGADTHPCTTTDSDPHNCGACGHDCLGGGCTLGVCQPFMLGTATDDRPYDQVVSGGKIYLLTASIFSGQFGAWQLDANTPSTPVKAAGAPTPNTIMPSCAMNGTLYWVAQSTTGSGNTITSCAFSSCASTAKPIVSGITDIIEIGPACDLANQELVWVTENSNFTQHTIYRASATGTNIRPMSSYVTALSGPSAVPGYIIPTAPTPSLDGLDQRLFYASYVQSSNTGTLYYVSTTVASATPVSIASFPGQVDNTDVLPGPTTVLFDTLPTGVDTSFKSLSAPLPNGVLTGSAPAFSGGGFNGVIDASYFYGEAATSGAPNGSIIRCSLAACLNVVVIATGQGNANLFVQDATAVYWEVQNQTVGYGFTVWKVAK